MQILYWNIAALCIAMLYYAWRDRIALSRRRKQLRERVTFMLWCAANQAA